MRWLAILFLGLIAGLPASAEDWTTADGKTYKNVTIVAQEDGGVRVTYTGGVGIIPYYELPLDVQKRLGVDSGSLEARQKAARQAADEAARNAAAATAAEMKAHPPTVPNTAPQPEGATQTASTPPPPSGSELQPGQTDAPAASTSTSTPEAPAPPAENQDPYPGSIYTYDAPLDACYLVSPAVSVALIPSDATKPPIADQGTLALRIESDGLKPAAPDEIEATFHSAVASTPTGAGHDIKFLVDGVYVPVEEMKNADADAPENISFYLSPAQAQSVFTGHNVNFSIAQSNYMVDESGITVFQKYLDTVDRLQHAPPSFSRMFRKFLAHLPPLPTIISAVCEYIFIGGSGLIILAALTLLVIGSKTIIKW